MVHVHIYAYTADIKKNDELLGKRKRKERKQKK